MDLEEELLRRLIVRKQVARLIKKRFRFGAGWVRVGIPLDYVSKEMGIKKGFHLAIAVRAVMLEMGAVRVRVMGRDRYKRASLK